MLGPGTQELRGVFCPGSEIRDVITQGLISQQLIEVRLAVLVKPFHWQWVEPGWMGQTWSHPDGTTVSPGSPGFNICCDFILLDTHRQQ